MLAEAVFGAFQGVVLPYAMTTTASVRIAREAPAEISFTIDTMLRKVSTPCAPVVMIVAVAAPRRSTSCGRLVETSPAGECTRVEARPARRCTPSAARGSARDARLDGRRALVAASSCAVPHVFDHNDASPDDADADSAGPRAVSTHSSRQTERQHT